ncbi:MAG TPA: acyl-CoA dehydrogenase family protein [Bryobacteraceae bacterium]|jgi:alkylation response protein AidB-like acyl-CoA dehydrogenase
MQFGLTETQQMLKNSAREFFPAECPMAEVRRLMEVEGAYDAKLWSKIAAQGWTGIIFDEQHGGMGLGLVELAVAAEEMGRALLPGPYFSTVCLAGALLDAIPEQRAHLRPICEGRERATVALMDANGARAELKGGALSGAKLFVPDACAADFTLVVCGDAVARVSRNAPGVSIKPMPSIDATRQLYEVSFAGTPAEILVSGPPAEAALSRALDVATLAVCAEMVGGMQRIMEISVEYAKTRKQFGKPIGQFQAVQHHCADMLLLTESSRSAVYYAAWALNEGAPDARTAVSIAKSYANEAYREVGNKGIQVHGGMGFTWENDIHLYYRRAKASEIAFGDTAYHRERIARAVVDR